MTLLTEIQASLMQQSHEIGPILLKLRFLASRLGSTALESWVRYESEGYPADAEVPDYRRVLVTYVATFSGPFGSGIKNAPIPSYLIDKFAGENWLKRELRQSISAIESLLNNDEGSLIFNTPDLILFLQGKVYEDYACNSVSGIISRAYLVEIQNVIRSRIFELTIELEKRVPESADVSFGQNFKSVSSGETDKVNHITNQIINGNVTNISNHGAGAKFNLLIGASDKISVVEALCKAGIDDKDAQEFAQIIASERAGNEAEPFGIGAKKWFAKNIGKAADGTWKIGVSVATQVLTEAALSYYGLK